MADKIKVGSKVTIAADTEIKGEVTLGSETVVHPKASILALGGPIVIGSGCIIEEAAVIINRGTSTMRIGDTNHFEVGCRVEAASIGSHNVFEVRCYVGPDVQIESFCTVGAGCTLVSDLTAATELDADQLLAQELEEDGTARLQVGEAHSGVEVIPERTVVFGHDSRRRLWSGEGVKQQAALHAKHLDYLRDCECRSSSS